MPTRWPSSRILAVVGLVALVGAIRRLREGPPYTLPSAMQDQ